MIHHSKPRFARHIVPVCVCVCENDEDGDNERDLLTSSAAIENEIRWIYTKHSQVEIN